MGGVCLRIEGRTRRGTLRTYAIQSIAAKAGATSCCPGLHTITTISDAPPLIAAMHHVQRTTDTLSERAVIPRLRRCPRRASYPIPIQYRRIYPFLMNVTIVSHATLAHGLCGLGQETSMATQNGSVPLLAPETGRCTLFDIHFDIYPENAMHLLTIQILNKNSLICKRTIVPHVEMERSGLLRSILYRFRHT
ncbi:hypothetical protein JOE11_000078 [Robbsia andropogonis]